MKRRAFLGLAALAVTAPKTFAATWAKVGNAGGAAGTWAKAGCGSGAAGTWQKVGSCIQGKGYCVGGSTLAGPSLLIDALDFATESVINLGTTPSLYGTSEGVASPSNGYLAGYTYIWSPQQNISKLGRLNFLADAVADTLTTLSSGRYQMASAYTVFRGYFAGGQWWDANLSPYTPMPAFKIDRLDFATETVVMTAASIAVVSGGTPAGVHSATRGYFAGGWTGAWSVTAEITGIEFATEATINPAANLSVKQVDGAGVNSASRGYIGGSLTWPGSGVTNEIVGILFATEAAINPAAALSVPRAYQAGVNSASRGYFCGGWSGSVRSSEIDGIEFATESAINPAAALGEARAEEAGVQSGAP